MDTDTFTLMDRAAGFDPGTVVQVHRGSAQLRVWSDVHPVSKLDVTVVTVDMPDGSTVTMDRKMLARGDMSHMF